MAGPQESIYMFGDLIEDAKVLLQLPPVPVPKMPLFYCLKELVDQRSLSSLGLD